MASTSICCCAGLVSFPCKAPTSSHTLAHSTATCEILLRYWLVRRGTFDTALTDPLQPYSAAFNVTAFAPALGLFLVIIGQLFRSLAMCQAGTSFNHVVQSVRKEDHQLVTTGVYSFSRHPAYFGFYWWALGTQLLLGNVVCLVAYAVVLWKFFGHRVKHEEKHLRSFFGEAYESYSERVSVWLPFINWCSCLERLGIEWPANSLSIFIAESKRNVSADAEARRCIVRSGIEPSPILPSF